MTHRLDDVTGSGDLASRWRALAEQRLEYLTELFESDRWRRFYSERSFLQDIQEAKAAVETWRNLSEGGAVASAHSGDVQRSAAAPVVPEPKLLSAVAEEAGTAASDESSSEPVVDLLALERVLEEEVNEPVLDRTAMEQRYPLLRNTL